MTNTNVSSRFDGLRTATEEGTQPLESGVLPDDFGQRLERLKEASGPQLARHGQGPRRGPQAAAQVAQGRRAVRGERCTRSSASQAGCPAAWKSSSARASR